MEPTQSKHIRMPACLASVLLIIGIATFTDSSRNAAFAQTKSSSATNDGSPIMASGSMAMSNAYISNWSGMAVVPINYIPDYNSVTVKFTPLPISSGAVDYRIFIVSSSSSVKYGGMLPPSNFDSYGNFTGGGNITVSTGSSSTSFKSSNQVAANTVLVYHSGASGNQSTACLVTNVSGPTGGLYTYTVSNGGGTTGLSVTPGAGDIFYYPTASDQIQINNLPHNTPVTLCIQAVNMTGPVSQASMYTSSNTPVLSSHNLLGSNMGVTTDGLMSTNGQGPYTNVPAVVAQSAPFTVTPSGGLPIPSMSSATSQFMETFQAAYFNAPDTTNPSHGSEHFVMNADNLWDVNEDLADNVNTHVFVADDHMMWILFDGGMASQNQPLHQGHGVVAFSPQQSFTVPPGAILHLTAQCDAYFEPRDWCSFFVYPANDSPTRFYPITDIPNVSGNEFEFDNQGNSINVWETTKSSAITSAFPSTAVSTGNGAYSICTIGAQNGTNPYWIGAHTPNGYGYDNRRRLDMFISDSQIEYFEDGVPIVGQGSSGNTSIFTMPGGLPWMDSAPVKWSFGGWTYHTAQRIQDELTYAPYNLFRISGFPYSGERHLDLMGAEVLPAGTSWSSLTSLVQLPTPVVISNSQITGTVGPPSLSGGTLSFTITPSSGSPVSVTATTTTFWDALVNDWAQSKTAAVTYTPGTPNMVTAVN